MSGFNFNDLIALRDKMGKALADTEINNFIQVLYEIQSIDLKVRALLKEGGNLKLIALLIISVV